MPEGILREGLYAFFREGWCCVILQLRNDFVALFLRECLKRGIYVNSVVYVRIYSVKTTLYWVTEIVETTAYFSYKPRAYRFQIVVIKLIFGFNALQPARPWHG